ncbi:MAG: DinB family protein [Ferruginibacter sp.]
MKEINRIINLFESTYNGSPWIDVSLIPVLQNITAAQAAIKLSPHLNSPWEIVNHLISWRKNVLKRLQGNIIKTPSHNYFVPVKNTSAIAWQKTLEELDISQKEWIHFLKEFKAGDFEKIYPNNNLSYYEHIHGIIQHDIYHLGQIVLLTKAMNK